jgi:hypothetical protein
MRYFYAFLLLGLGLGRSAHAQQPFLKYGVTVKVATLSNGRFPEFFTNDSLRRIGSVVYDTRLRRVAYLLPPDSLVGHAKPDITSRWISPDPLAEKDNFISPYAFARNNAIRYNDPDGREVADYQDGPRVPGKPIKPEQAGPPRLRPNNVAPRDATNVRHPPYTPGRVYSAAQANKEFAANGYTRPPVRPNTPVREFETVEGEKFVRVFREGGGSNPMGRWMFRDGAVKGLSPAQIQSKYSLPEQPTHMVPVSPPAGTTMQQSIAGEAFPGQPGGGVQYFLKGEFPVDAFGTPAPLPTVAPIEALPVMPMPVIEPVIEPLPPTIIP